MSWLCSALLLAALCAIVAGLRRSPLFSSRFAYRPDEGPYFFAKNCLVMNYRIPLTFPLADIARVEFQASGADRARPVLRVHVLLKTGKKQGFRFQNPPPDFGVRWQEALEQAGVRCLRI